MLAAKSATDLDGTVTKTFQYLSDGVETRRSEAYRLGNYFDRIDVKEAKDGSSLTLTFWVRPSADSLWKDLVMAILRSIRDSVGAFSVEFAQPSS